MDNKQNKVKHVDKGLTNKDWNDGTLEEVLASAEPKIYIHNVLDKSDGGCDIEFETNKAFDEWYKKEKGRKRATKKGVSKFVNELLKNAISG